jgi:hypothetical protein
MIIIVQLFLIDPPLQIQLLTESIAALDQLLIYELLNIFFIGDFHFELAARLVDLIGEAHENFF